MARCIPEIDTNFNTQGERKVFSLLKQLPDSCLVYYEMVIGERDRRPDFVVIDINRGITIFEVKDWGIDTILKATPTMFEIASKQNRTMKQLNPEHKIKTYLEDLREQLSTQEILCDDKGRLRTEIRYYVVFPNMTKDEFAGAGLSKVVNPNFVIFKEDVKNFEAFKNKYDNNCKDLDIPLSPQKWNAIRVALFPELIISGTEQWFTANKSKGPVISESNDSAEFGLDIFQEQVAKSLGTGPRFLHGIAGTGKTLILLFHAKLMSANGLASGQSPKILVLCWNISLAQYMRHAYRSIQIPNTGEIEIVHFSAFARRIIRSSPGIYFPRSTDPDFDTKLTETLSRVKINPIQKYDIVYIDEAQDFQKDWIKFIFDNLIFGQANDKNLVIAGDYAQHIYKYRDFAESSGFTWKSIGIPMVGRTRTLKKIYRNSARVWSFAAAFMGDINRYYQEDKETKIEFAPKRGFDPQLIKCESIEEQIDKAVDIVSRLSEQGYSPRNAMILYRWATHKGYPLIQNLVAKLNQKGICNQWITEDNEKKATFEWGEESVKISTVHSAKGMDAPVVIILGAEAFRQNDDNFDDEEKLLYVALTRAREFLVVLHTGNSGMVPKLTDAMKDYKKYRKQIVELEKLANENFVI
ncbi:MAG: hypothetical protein EHM20_08520 [Alphaproteobacteria bacterium]|nr:MAG: hypothetical protein EHM20_08520 [Alphaproteobacteria bacterium]